MEGTAFVILALVVLVPLSAFIGLGLWARWLCLRTPSPRWLVYPAASAPTIIATLGVAAGFLQTCWRFEGDSPGQRASLLAQSVSETMNVVAFSFLIAAVSGLWLLAVTWRYRWSRNRAPSSL